MIARINKSISIILIALLLLSGCTYTTEPLSEPTSEAPTQAIIETPQGKELGENSYFEITYLDVGNADAALVICNGFSMLIDGGEAGDSDLIYAFLGDKKISHLDYIISSHAHSDHVGGLSGALHATTVGSVLCPVSSYDSKAFTNFVKAVENQGLTLENQKRERLSLWEVRMFTCWGR